MCGINGVFSTVLSREEIISCISKMNRALAHRGPDNEGYYYGNNFALGHTRLSIIDLSENGNQPFFSENKKLIITFNGEIYNYKELRLELQRSPQGSNFSPHFFKTQTDTEVILAAYQRWGIDCLKKLNGMFAFCIINQETGEALLARDRLGVKPLYYNYSEKGFLFSSEVRGIIRSGIKQFNLNKSFISEYIQYQTIHAPNTPVKGIYQLMPGHYLEYKNGKLTETEYWNPKHYIQKNSHLSYQETCEKVSELLYSSVQNRMISDVPLGAFLSGGIDSSITVGLMARISSEPVHTFHITSSENNYSESSYAKLIAKKYNTRHTEIFLRPEVFLKELEPSLQAMDFPGGDGPNTYVVSKSAKNAGITVALSGIGGDELFAGYPNFLRLRKLHRSIILKSLPPPLLKIAGKIIELTGKNQSTLKKAELLKNLSFTLRESYPLSRSLFTKNELKKICGKNNALENIKNLISDIEFPENKILSGITCMELKTYLLNVLLKDSDQMSMAHALEIREPLLDYRLVEFILSLTDEVKMPHTPKKLLTDSTKGILPEEIIHRPKMGFTLPWQHWMKNELRSFCEKNIVALNKKEILEPQAALVLWNRFLKNDPAITWSRIWHLVALNYWIELNLEKNNG